jgi:hypothetical protein
MIRLNHVTLPPGLRAMARRDPHGDLELFVSRTLPADRRRAAVRVALAASRRAGWSGELLPVPVAAMLVGAGRWLGRIGRLLRLHPVTTAAVSAMAITGAVVGVAVVPHAPSHVSGGVMPVPPAAVAPAPGQGSSGSHSASSPRTGKHGHAGGTTHLTPGAPGKSGSPAPGHSTTPAPGHSTTPAPGHSTTPAPGHSTTPAPSESAQPTPTQSSSPTTQPKPTPTPSPTRTGNGDCVKLLGLTVCL